MTQHICPELSPHLSLMLAMQLQEGDTGVTMEQVAAAIRQRKAQLAPAIQELRSLRQQQQVGYVCA